MPPAGGDGGADAPGPTIPATCGNGTLESGELCDGQAVACTTLGASWGSGDAKCRVDCSGFDVSACQVSAMTSEVVAPSARIPSYATATCNDGTPFEFIVSVSPTRSNKWVIYLEGGGRCDGRYNTCVGRSTYLTSSKSIGVDRSPGTPGQINGTIMSRDPAVNPELADANYAKAHYCSSDVWTGTNTTPQPIVVKANGATADVTFTGHINVGSMLDTLRRNYGLDDATSDILLSGGSAGGMGVLQNTDQLTDRFPLAHAQNRLAAAPSAAWSSGMWNDPAFPPNAVGDSAQTMNENIMAIYKGQPGARCAARMTAAGKPVTSCLAGPVMYAALTEPAPAGLGLRVLVLNNRVDQLPMNDFGIPREGPNLTATERAARDTWLAQMTQSMANVKWVYAPADPNTAGEDNLHGVVGDGQVWNYQPPNGLPSLKTLFGRFWTERTSPGERVLYEGPVPHGNVVD